MIRWVYIGVIAPNVGVGGCRGCFPASSGTTPPSSTTPDENYKFTSLCLAPGSRDIIVVGQETTSNGAVGVERLRPSARGSGLARRFYPITGAVPDTSRPTTTQTVTFTVPSGFISAQGYTVNSRGQILVSGDTSADAEMLTAIAGTRVLG